jgi:hypothetical protein
MIIFSQEFVTITPINLPTEFTFGWPEQVYLAICHRLGLPVMANRKTHEATGKKKSEYIKIFPLFACMGKPVYLKSRN